MLNHDLQKAIQALQISDISLVEVTAKRGKPFDDATQGLSIQWRPPGLVEFAQSSDFGFVAFRISASVRVFDGKAPASGALTESERDRLVAEVSSSFVAKFAVREGVELESPCLEEYGRHNVPFVIWPYWRELVQSTIARLGLSTVVLPVFRLSKSATSESKTRKVRSRKESTSATSEKP